MCIIFWLTWIYKVPGGCLPWFKKPSNMRLVINVVHDLSIVILIDCLLLSIWFCLKLRWLSNYQKNVYFGKNQMHFRVPFFLLRHSLVWYLFIFIYIYMSCSFQETYIILLYLYDVCMCILKYIYICILFMFVDIHFTNLSFFQDMYIYLFIERDFYYVYYFFLAGGVDNT